VVVHLLWASAEAEEAVPRRTLQAEVAEVVLVVLRILQAEVAEVVLVVRRILQAEVAGVVLVVLRILQAEVAGVVLVVLRILQAEVAEVVLVVRRILQAEVAEVVLVVRRILQEGVAELAEHQFQQAEEVAIEALVDPQNRPLTAQLMAVGAAQSLEPAVEEVGDYWVSEAAAVEPNAALTGLRVVHVAALKVGQVIEMEGTKNRPSDSLHVPVEEEAVEVLSLISSRL
jgi:hypothetical protein